MQAERSNEDLAKLRTKLTGDLASVTLQLEAERRANADNEKAVRRVRAQRMTSPAPAAVDGIRGCSLGSSPKPANGQLEARGAPHRSLKATSALRRSSRPRIRSFWMRRRRSASRCRTRSATISAWALAQTG